MQERLSEYAFDHLNYLIAPESQFMEKFEQCKSDFGSSNPPEPFRLPLSIRRGRQSCILPDFNQRTEQFIIAVQDVQSLFDPVIYNIISLVKSQITAAGREYGHKAMNEPIMAVSNGSALAALREKMNGGHIRVTSPRHYGFGSPFRKSTFYLLRINGATRFNKQTEEDEIKWVIAKISRMLDSSTLISPV
ncbi:unnamed protein product [Penicillium palitans]